MAKNDKNPDPLGDLGNMWHNKICGRLKREGLGCRVLDKNGGIDCYVYNKNDEKQGFLCEIKSIITGGFDKDIAAHISGGDKKFLNAISVDSDDAVGFRKYEYDYDHDGFVNEIKNKLQEALTQYNQVDLTSFNINKNRKPFVVVLCFDFFAGFPDQVDFLGILEKLPSISAIMMLEKNNQREQIKKRHLEELNRYYRDRHRMPNLEDPSRKWGLDYEGTQDTVDFKVYINLKTSVVFKPSRYFKKYVQ